MTIQELFELLESCPAIYLYGEGKIVFPSMSELTGEDDNEFCYIEWEDDEGLVFNLKLSERGINEYGIQVNDYDLTIHDSEGEPVKLQFLVFHKLK